MSQVMIGDPKRFGVEFELDVDSLHDPKTAEFLFGRVRFWCGGQGVGLWSETTPLCSLAAHSKYVIDEEGKRSDCALCREEPASAVRLISSALYEDNGQPDYLVAADHSRYAALVVTPSVDVFDPWRIVLIECEFGARLIWYMLDEPEIHECRLKRGEYEDVLRAFVAHLLGAR